MNLTRSFVSITFAAALACATLASNNTPPVTVTPSAINPNVSSASSQQVLSCSLPPPPQIQFCSSTGNTLTAIVSGGVTPYTFSWNLAGDGHLTGGQGTQTITFNIGLGPVALALTVSDAAGGTAQCSATVRCTPQPPAAGLCTLSQGFYGNSGSAFNGTRSLALMQGLLPAGDLVIGKPGRSVTLALPAAACIIQRLPATGRPRALPSSLGDSTISQSTCQSSPVALPLDSSGRLSNTLLGQTIVLSLNTRLSAGLGSVQICNIMTMQASHPGPDGLFGTNDDVRNPGPDGALGTLDDPMVTLNIPYSVTTALSALGLTNTVNGLLELANRGLAGETTGGASLDDLNAAVNAVNTGFGGCRFLLNCSNF